MNLSRKIIRILFPLLSLTAFLFSQEVKIVFDHLNIRNGLSDGRIDCILQDSYGFLWFGTQDGLNRYDGYNFTVFDHDIYDSTSISSNWIRCLYEDKSHNLWIGTEGGGLNRFNPGDESFSWWIAKSGSPQSLSDNFVRTIIEDSYGILWIGTRSGMVQFDWRVDVFIPFHYEPSNPNSPVFTENVTKIIEDRDRNLWIGTPDNVYRYNRKDQTVEHISFDAESERISALFEDSAGNVWIGSRYNGLRKYDRSTRRFTRYQTDATDPTSLGSNEVKDIFEDRDKNIWIATVQGGLNLFEPATNGFRRYWNDPGDPSSLSSNSARIIYQDQTGVIWIGMDGSGIDSFVKNRQKFRLYGNRVSNPSGLSNNTILAIFEDNDGTLWVGTEGGGLNKFSRRDREFIQYKTVKNQPNSISSDHVTCIINSNLNDLWIGTKEGLNLFDRQRGTFQRFYNRTTPVTGNNFINIIRELPDGQLLLGTNGGLCYFFKQGGEFRQLDYNDNNPLNNEAVESILIEKPDLLWIGYLRSGLVKFNLTDTTYIHYRSDENKSNSLSDNFTQYIHRDRAGNLWIATRKGLNRLNQITGEFSRYTKADGLPSNVVVGILEDKDGNLWLSTTNGLSRFNIKEKTFINYDVNDGLQGNQFWIRSCFKNRNGELFFGGNNGFNSFSPDSFKTSVNPVVPPVVITNVTILDNTPIHNAYADSAELHLSYKENQISFEFAVLDFTRPEKNQFVYMLEGFDNDWIHAGTRRYANYTNLDPGRYTFKVKGANSDGVWNEKGAALTILIGTPFWKTWWAYILYIILAGGLIYGVNAYTIGLVRVRHDLKIERMEKEKEKEINQFKLQFFTDVAHELKTPLTLIQAPLEEILTTIKKGAPYEEEYRIMHRNVKYLLRLIHQLLTFRRAEQGREGLKVSRGDLIQFVREVFEIFNETARKHHIVYQFNADARSIEGWFDWEKLEEILVNIIDNAFKYTPERGNITVSLAKTNATENGPAQVVFTVTDTGLGISRENLGHIFERFFHSRNSLHSSQISSGIGLALTKRLVELHHGAITVNSQEGQGSQFTVTLPLDRDFYSDDEIISNIAETAHYRLLMRAPEEPDQSIKEQPAVLPEVTTSTESPLILLVEDNEEFRTYLRKTLARKYRIAEAGDGTEGIALAKKLIPNIIISDVMMPHTDGIELCRQLKNEVATSHIPIILLTAKTAIEHKIEGIETGADDYIEKPFHFRFLDARIKNILKSREKLRERYRRELILEPNKVTAASADEKFLMTIRGVVTERLSDPQLEIKHLASEAGLSRTNLFLKLKALTRYTPQEFIKTIRLEQAAQLLRKTDLTVSEIAYRVGFKYPKYFSTCFLQQYRLKPSEYRKSNQP